jgi:hypothetical protein
MQLEHSFPRFKARKWNIDTFLEPGNGEVQQTDRLTLLFCSPSLDSIVQSPRNIRGSEYKHTSVIVTNTIHLNQKLRLDASRPLRLALVTSSSEGINFVNKDDSWFAFSRHLKQLSHKP